MEAEHSTRLLGRFEVLSELGRGGYGRVLRCFDHELGHEVALKQLERITPAAIDDFKREFRILLDIRHPNIVRLGELLEVGGSWFIAQELVEGVDFHSYVTREEQTIPPDTARLVDALSQVFSALAVLHAQGVVHRDIKPDNVRVTDAGRVVLLDFGIAAEPSTMETATNLNIVGTPAYMAPEQIDGAAITPEADLYAAGVMLFEALTGRLPFLGSTMEMLLKKRERAAPRPSVFVDGIAPEIEELCFKLLSQNPKERPSASDVLARLTRSGRGTGSSPQQHSLSPRDVFVGRGTELAELRQHYLEVCNGPARAVVIEGESGIGKSALLGEFLRRAGSFLPKPLIARGRCHAAEQLRYKAFDALSDALGKKLARRGEMVKLSLQDFGLVLVLFPTLAAALRTKQTFFPARQPERTAMFRAFARLLAQAASDQTLILAIDDLQWSDEDSLQLLESLLHNEQLENVLFVFTLRPAAEQDARMKSQIERLLTLPSMHHIRLDCLSIEESRALLDASLSESGVHAIDEGVLASTRGHPYLLSELMQQGAEGNFIPGSLEFSLKRRVLALSPLEQELLLTLAIANTPVSTRVLLRTAKAESESVNRAVRHLRAERLSRVARPGTLSFYHDRLRLVLLEDLPAAVIAQRFLALAVAHAQEPEPDPAQVAFYFLAANAGERAIPWLERALQAAREHAAFARALDHASSLLALATDATRKRELLTVRAELFGFLGRGREASDDYLAAMEDADAETSTRLCIRAAEQLLRNGEPAAGLEVAKRAFALAGLSWSDSAFALVMRALFARMSVNLSKDPEPSESKPSGNETLQLEALLALSQPLAWIDWVRGAEVSMRLTRLALRNAQPRYMAYALHAQAIVVGMEENKKREYDKLLQRARRYVELDGSADARAHHDFANALARFGEGDFKGAYPFFDAAETRYRTDCPEEAWQLANVRGLFLQVFYWLGKHREHRERATLYIEDAEQRGDRFAGTMAIVTGLGYARHLMDDQPEAALTELHRIMEAWQGSTFGAQHFGAWLAEHYVLAYALPDKVADFWTTVRERHGSPLLLRLPILGDLNRTFVALGLLARRVHRPGDVTAVRELARYVERMGRPRSQLGRAFFPYVRAQRAMLDGAPREQIASFLEDSKLAVAQIGHHWMEHVELLESYLEGPSAFRAREQRTLSWYGEQGWRAPERALTMGLPIYPHLKG